MIVCSDDHDSVQCIDDVDTCGYKLVCTYSSRYRKMTQIDDNVSI